MTPNADNCCAMLTSHAGHPRGRLAKHRVQLIIGVGRSTIDRILTVTASGGAINGPSGGGNDR